MNNSGLAETVLLRRATWHVLAEYYISCADAGLTPVRGFDETHILVEEALQIGIGHHDLNVWMLDQTSDGSALTRYALTSWSSVPDNLVFPVVPISQWRSTTPVGPWGCVADMSGVDVANVPG
ncbi:MAG TPA: hypothetical protein PLZ93_01685 [Nocardioides sp.]|uniref:hypothetical protein n=1 Tax=uncultured Nocardioides sp. TaxID=198441 RepID=UPI002626FBB9|nr:hypothetical protein [uncultured Nocardioides sp.]HRI94306.1 hypothetical protein [Nocardioides sp.]HRK44252.1 hypothetical protein [Nocardioides sp.]